MVKHARETSIKRGIKRPHEDHGFDEPEYYRMILQRIRESKMTCECILCLSRGTRQALSIRGPNKMSMDRVHNDLGYTHQDQVLRLISKNHHSAQDRDAVPLEVTSRRRKWSDSTLSGMIKRSKKRYDRTRKEIQHMKKALMDVDAMITYLGTHVTDKETLRSLIERLRMETPNCAKCGVPLEYGDDKGYLVTKKNPRQASPDRLNDRIGYTPDNVQMVCCACQTIGEVDDAEDIFLDEAGLIDLEKYLEDKIASLD